MPTCSHRTKRNLEMQGFVGLDDTAGRIDFWLRLAPAICMLWAAVGTALASATVLWWLVPFAALGAILPGHPFDALYTYGLRHWVGGPPLPRYPLPRRFACLLATLMLIGAAWSFQTGTPLLGRIIGWSLVAAACVNVSTGFCVPSFIYGLLFGKPSSHQVAQ